VVKTLAEITPPLPTAAPAPEAANPLDMPFWLVVVGRNGRVKYVFGYAAEGEAEAERERRQAAENSDAVQGDAGRLRHVGNVNKMRAQVGEPLLPNPEPVPPRQYHVIHRPEGGSL
jgi:hypothetical protein